MYRCHIFGNIEKIHQKLSHVYWIKYLVELTRCPGLNVKLHGTGNLYTVTYNLSTVGKQEFDSADTTVRALSTICGFLSLGSAAWRRYVKRSYVRRRNTALITRKFIMKQFTHSAQQYWFGACNSSDFSDSNIAVPFCSFILINNLRFYFFHKTWNRELSGG